MQNKTNTILLVLIVVLLAVGVWFLAKNGNMPRYDISDIVSTQEINTNTPPPVSTVNKKTYTDPSGFSLKYSLNTTMATSKGFGGDPITSLNVPFKDAYTKFTGKSFSMQNYAGTCELKPSTKRTINGVEYYYLNPAWTDTSGMSSISYFKRYLIERDSKCFIFSETISGTGINETPPGATAPSGFQIFFDSEMKDLDAIMASVTWPK